MTATANEEVVIGTVNVAESLQDLTNVEDSELPRPTGYKLLVFMPILEEKTKSGIVVAPTSMDKERIASVIGYVIDIGPDAYRDPNRFPSGAFCKAGDFIIMRSYTGTRFTVRGREFRLINDDSVEAVVENPDKISRIK